jgi:hypothetical protein
MGYDTERMIKALDGAGVYLRKHQGEEYVAEIADAVTVLYKHMTYLDIGNRRSWDMSVMELLSIFGRAEGMVQFTPEPEPESPPPPRLVGGSEVTP